MADHTLGLNMLHGLNERYCDIGVHLSCGDLFPSFASVCNEFLLEEINMAHKPVAHQPSSSRRAPWPISLLRPGWRLLSTSAETEEGEVQVEAQARWQQLRSWLQHHPRRPCFLLAWLHLWPGGQWPSFYNPWTGFIQIMWPGSRTPPLAQLPQWCSGPQQQLAQQQVPSVLPAYGAPVQQTPQPP